MKYDAWIMVSLLLAVPACGGDQKSAEERQEEAQRAIQQGVQKEKQMFEGMVKGVEGLEKKADEKSK